MRIVLKGKKKKKGEFLLLNLVVRSLTIVTRRAVNIPKDFTTVGTAWGYKKQFSSLCSPDVK